MGNEIHFLSQQGNFIQSERILEDERVTSEMNLQSGVSA